MENMQYAEELVREFLVFRGFTNTLQAFEAELNTDIGKGFQVDKLSDLIFSVYIPKFQAEKLVMLLSFIRRCLCSTSESVLMEILSKLEISISRYYIIYAMQLGREDKVVEFFAMCGSDLIQRDHDWAPWFAIPYAKNPSLEPCYRVYFSKEWQEALRISVRNFFSEVFDSTRIPALLKISSEKDTVNRLKKDIKQLNLKLAQLQALLEEKEAQLCQLGSKTSAKINSNLEQVNSSTKSISLQEDNLETLADSQEVYAHKSLSTMTSGSAHETSSLSRLNATSHVTDGIKGENELEDELPEVKVDFQETFLGHTSPITRCRFSASGSNIASASMDGTVRIWTYDSSAPASRNATIYCGAEIMSLEWDCKSDRLLLIGTADGGIKAWNVDAKRVVCDLNTTKEFPSVLDLKCSPVEPIFVSAAASRRNGSTYTDSLGFASLTVWNMKTWKAMTVLPLGEDAPAITSLCFNHNGKILAASATDGMIHMFDMSAGLQITGWPAHDSAITSILFGSDETSIFSLGSDGKIFEWNLHNQGQLLWSKDWSRFLESPNIRHPRHEMALDASGRRLLVTSASVRAPIYQVASQSNGFKTLPHSASITTVDWHPTSPIFLTGSDDNSVRVTSIL